MLNIPINNPEILETLDKFLWFYNEREGEVAQCRLWCNNEDRDHFTGDNHRDSIMSRGSIHTVILKTASIIVLKQIIKVLVNHLPEKS